MKKIALYLCLLVLVSCSRKYYFQDAEKLKEGSFEHIENENVFIDAFYAGDALNYIVFELDIVNETTDTIQLVSEDVFLRIFNRSDSIPTIVKALDNVEIIQQIERTERQLSREKKARDVGNAFTIGLAVLSAATGTYNTADAFIYSAETAVIMLEDAHVHKLVKGDLEEQIQYVEEWVLDDEYVNPSDKGSWDVLFPRTLYDAEALLVITVNEKELEIPFRFITVEERRH